MIFATQYSGWFFCSVNPGFTMKITIKLAAALLGASILMTGCAEFKSAGKTIGVATKEAATDIGHGTRRVAKEIAK
jgi:hypothetical protein